MIEQTQRARRVRVRVYAAFRAPRLCISPGRVRPHATRGDPLSLSLSFSLAATTCAFVTALANNSLSSGDCRRARGGRDDSTAAAAGPLPISLWLSLV